MFYTNHVLTYVPLSEEVGVVLAQAGRESSQDGGTCHVDVRLFLSARNILRLAYIPKSMVKKTPHKYRDLATNQEVVGGETCSRFEAILPERAALFLNILSRLGECRSSSV